MRDEKLIWDSQNAQDVLTISISCSDIVVRIIGLECPKDFDCLRDMKTDILSAN